MSGSPSDKDVLERLYAVIVARRGSDADQSYTAGLFAAGAEKIAQKLGEEAVEAVIAGATGKADALVRESADLLYHLLVMWAETGVIPDDVWAELAHREGTSGLAEKAGRNG